MQRPAPPWSRRARAGNPFVAAPPSVSTTPNYAPGRRDLFLAQSCFENQRAHWFIYVPSVTDLDVGKVIHVTGNVHNGFGFEIRLNWDRTKTRNTAIRYSRLGDVDARLVVDGYAVNASTGVQSRTQPNPSDRIETEAFIVPMPYRNPDAVPPPADDPIWANPHPDFERCQDWTRRLVRRLVELSILSQDALQVLESAISYGLPAQ